MFDTKDLIFEGLAYTVMGITIVFLMLVIIMYVIKAMALFSKEKESAQKAAPAPAPAPAPQAENTAVQKTDDSELVAVITAAVCAAMGKSASELVVRSYKKLSQNAWNKAGRRETLDNRF